MILPLTALSLALTLPAAPQKDRDADRDGLSDFHERYKYGTDPDRADSDGDGIDDGDWEERREYAYTVRAVVDVMRPVTPEYLNDDYQDVRILEEGEQHVRLEVIHYPFNQVANAMESTKRWSKVQRELREWLEPGATSNWTPKLRKQILRALKKDGIDVGKLDDREVVEQVSSWLLEHAEYHDGFSTFITSFDEKGRPFVEEDLEPAVVRGKDETSMTLEEQWERELFAAGMFATGRRGSCTSSAIYLNGCMRAVGIPTRTILCIPLVDGTDPEERKLLENLENHRVREIVTDAAERASRGWTSHTYNEVWVGGRWRRLNYSNLGQNILDANCLGLMTHIATFHDWADADMPSTVGRRQSSNDRDDVFGHTNPYSTVELEDRFGPHCKLPNPTPEVEVATVSALEWTDSPRLPKDISRSCEEKGRLGFIAVVRDFGGSNGLRRFLEKADLRLRLQGKGGEPLRVEFHPGCWWTKNDKAYIYIPMQPSKLKRGVSYAVEAFNEREGHLWAVDLTVERQGRR